MLDHAEDAGRIIRISKPLPSSPCEACNLLERVEFQHQGSPAVVDTYVKGWRSFLCQYVSGRREGEEFELGQSELEAALGEPIVLETDDEAPTIPNSMYTAQAVRTQQRGMISLALFAAAGLVLTLTADRRAPDLPQKPAVMKKAGDGKSDGTEPRR